MENILLSGFADEISPDFNRQIQVLNRLGKMCIRDRTDDGPASGLHLVLERLH